MNTADVESLRIALDTVALVGVAMGFVSGLLVGVAVPRLADWIEFEILPRFKKQ